MDERQELTFTEAQIDALKEVGNIGAGHAATALSQMVNKKKIMITVPEVKVVEKDKIFNYIDEPDALSTGVIMNVLGDVVSKIIMLIKKESALYLADLLLKKKPGTSKLLTEMENSAVKEIGNILSGAYMNALNEFLGLMLLPSVPNLVFDTSAAILTAVLDSFEDVSSKILSIETQFIETNEKILKGYLLLMPDTSSVKIILDAIKVK
ncbi:MAG TPA: chemotaxis protein CheC [Candidatus Goldiibacteriota bacterium]|nr:chemotaxis protein CheC [Candidatus Goldiibacteriota bacterium]